MVGFVDRTFNQDTNGSTKAGIGGFLMDKMAKVKFYFQAQWCTDAGFS